MLGGKEQLLETPGCSADTTGRPELLSAETGRDSKWNRLRGGGLETGYLGLDVLPLRCLSDTPVAL